MTFLKIAGLLTAFAILCAGTTTLIAQESLDTSNRIPGVAPSTIPSHDENPLFEREADIDMSGLGKAIVYPDSARKAKLSGRVILRCLVGKSGTIDSVIVQSATHPIFIPPSVAAVRSLRGTPAFQHGRNVMSWFTLPIVYDLK